MTPDEWFTEPDYARHLRFLEARISARKQRLLAAAFSRAVWHLFDHPDLRAAVETAERFADGRATAAELEAVRQRCREVAIREHEAWERSADWDSPGSVLNALRSRAAWAAAFTATTPVSAEDVADKLSTTAVEAQTGDSGILIRDRVEWARLMEEQQLVLRAVVWEVVGNPFAPVAFRAEWRTGTAVALAAQMYESGDFSAMPILADALQDAGCDSDEVLDHCRNPGTHARGCWVVDLVLGKS